MPVQAISWSKLTIIYDANIWIWLWVFYGLSPLGLRPPLMRLSAPIGWIDTNVSIQLALAAGFYDFENVFQ